MKPGSEGQRMDFLWMKWERKRASEEEKEEVRPEEPEEPEERVKSNRLEVY